MHRASFTTLAMVMEGKRMRVQPALALVGIPLLPNRNIGQVRCHCARELVRKSGYYRGNTDSKRRMLVMCIVHALLGALRRCPL